MNLNRKKLLKFALINFIVGLVVLLIAYFFFHYVTDSGITTVHQEEAGKPFVTSLIGNFGVLFLFASVVSLISSFVFCEKDKK